MTDNVFLDTNILLYALTNPKDKKDIYKREISLEMIDKCITTSNIIISSQVINELHYNLIKKFSIADSVVFDVINRNVLSISTVKDLSYKVYHEAYTIRQKYKISFWDSLILSSAFLNKCTTIYTEDMQNGLQIYNKLKVLNPF